MGSTTGTVNAMPGQATYAAAKAGLVGLSRALALEVVGHGVTVNVVAPGYVATGSQLEFEAAAAAAGPIGRSGTPAEIASCVGVSRARIGIVRHRRGAGGRRRARPAGDLAALATGDPLPRLGDPLGRKVPDLAATKCAAMCSAASPRWESVTTAIFFTCRWWSRTKRMCVTSAPKLSQPGKCGASMISPARSPCCSICGSTVLAQVDEVADLQGGLRPQGQHRGGGVEVGVDHGVIPCLAQARLPSPAGGGRVRARRPPG